MRAITLLAAGIVLCGLALAGCAPADTAAPNPPAAATTTTTTTMISTTDPITPIKAITAPPTSFRPTAKGILGPDGYGKIRLGMSYAEVRAAGVVKQDETFDHHCNAYEMFTDGKSDGYVFITKERGVEAIEVTVRVSTPEKASVGSSVAKVRAAYPSIEIGGPEEYARGYTPVPGNARAVYRIQFHDGFVQTISLQRKDQSCYE